MRLAGIDIGTTRTKVVIYDTGARRVVAERAGETPVRHTAEGDAHRAEEVVAVVRGLLDAAIADAGAPVAAIGAGSFGEEIVLVGDDGEPVDEVLAWYDPRGRELAPPFLRAHGSLLRGMRPDPSFTLFKLLWLAEHRPAALARAARLADMGDYVLWRLGGGRDVATLRMDWSHASRTGLLDLAARRWAADVLGAAGLDGALLPELVPSGTVLGTADRNGAALVTGGHDHFCGAFAAGVRRAGEVLVSAGTSEAILVLTDRLPDVAGAPEPVDAGCFVDERHWYLHLAVPSGQLYRQWLAMLYAGSEAEAARELALAPVGSRGVRCAVDPTGPRVNLAGVGVDAGRGDILRALMEGLAAASRFAIERLEAAAGAVAAGPVLVGGQATADATWCDLRAGVLARPLSVLAPAESAALGAALLAQRALTGEADDGVVRRAPWPRAGEAAAAAYSDVVAWHRDRG